MRTGVLIAIAAVLGVLTAATTMRHASRANAEQTAAAWTGGDPRRGRDAMVALGCIACHDVPGFSGTKPRVGPSLAGFGSSTFVGGAVENTPMNLVRFIRSPRAVAPRSAMPTLPMSEAEARDLAAFLYTLR